MERYATGASNTLSAFSDELAAIVERARQAVVGINARPRMAVSGVLWLPGVIVTANHAIRQVEGSTVALPDGNIVPAELAGRDPTTDLAVLKSLQAVPAAIARADDSALRVGHLMIAVGHAGPGAARASLGTVSALGGPWRTWRGGLIDRLIRLDIPLYFSFSGTVLLDARGSIVGINTLGLWRNAALTIPISTIDRVVRELLEKGRISRAYLGLGMQPVRLQEAIVSKLNLASVTGVIVLSVDPRGPAAEAGVLVGDVLLELDGQTLSDIGEVYAALSGARPGALARAKLLRGGELRELAITLAERPTRGC
jgi:S1-C subfamily serine protease